MNDNIRRQALAIGMYQIALKQRRQGNDQLFEHLKPYARMAQGNPEELGFFLEGDDQFGYFKEEQPRQPRRVLAALGLALGIGIGSLVAQAIDVPKADAYALYENK